MKRRLGLYLAVGVSLAILIYGLRHPLTLIMAHHSIGSYCRAALGASVGYSDLVIGDGEILLRNALVDTGLKGYRVSVEEVRLPCILGLGYFRVNGPVELVRPSMTIRRGAKPAPILSRVEWTMIQGVIAWEGQEDRPIQLELQRDKATICFGQEAEQGSCYLHEGLWHLRQVPCDQLVKLLQWVSPVWLGWEAREGRIDGWLDLGQGLGQMEVLDGRLEHQHLPVALAYPRGQLLFDGNGLMMANCPLEVYMGRTAQTNFHLPPHSWRLGLHQPDGWILQLNTHLEDVWRLLDRYPNHTGSSAVALSAEIHSTIDETQIDGSFVVDSGDTVVFGMQFNPHQDPKGWLRGQALPLGQFFAPFTGKFNQASWKGYGDIEGFLQGDLWAVELGFQEVVLETASYRLELDELESSARVLINLRHGIEDATLPLKRGSFTDKISGLQFEALSTDVESRGNEICFHHLEAYHGNLHFTGEGILTSLSDSETQLVLHAESLTGQLSELKDMLLPLHTGGFLQALPLDGNIALTDEGADLRILASSQGRDVAVEAHGLLMDGWVPTDLAHVVIEEVSAQFSYSFPSNALNLTDLQGTVLVGTPGERIEEYQIIGDRLDFPNYAEQTMHFDFWIGDRRRDVMRLAGSTSQDLDGRIHFQFQRDLTHFGRVHPEVLELVLASWNQVDTLHLALEFKLETILHDLQRLGRTGLINIDEMLMRSLAELRTAQGLGRMECGFDRADNIWRYQLSGDQLTLNSHTFTECRLSGKIQENNWTVDQFKIDDFSLSAEIRKFPDFWRIDFLGLRYGKGVLAGLDGTYSASKGGLNTKVHLLDIDFASLFPFPIKGSWKGSGQLNMDLAQAPHRYPLFAELNGSLKEVVANGIRIDHSSNVRMEVRSDQGSPVLKVHLDEKAVQLTEAPYLIRDAVLTADSDQLRIDTLLSYQDRPLWASFQTSWRNPQEGKLVLSDVYPPLPQSLSILWEQRPNLGFIATRAEGTLFGMKMKLRRDPRQAPFDDTTIALGQVDIDWSQLASFLSKKKFDEVGLARLGGGYQLKGTWKFLGVLPKSIDFEGDLIGQGCEIAGCHLDQVSAKIHLSQDDIQLDHLMIEDAAGQLTLGHLELLHRAEDGWDLAFQDLEIKDFDPVKLKGFSEPRLKDLSGICVSSAKIPHLSGRLGDSSSYLGEGSLQFVRSTLHQRHGSTMAKDLLDALGSASFLSPATGHLNWHIADGRFVINSLQDVYSEGKLLKFSLAKNSPPATIDFRGNIDMVLRIKQTRSLVKLTEKSLLTVGGSLWAPHISFLD